MRRARVFRHAAAAAMLLTSVAWSAPAHAQDDPPAQGRGGTQIRPAELTAMLDAYTVLQAQRALQLTDAQYGDFVTRLKRLQENRRRNTQIRNRLLQELRTMTAPNAVADDNALKEKLRAFREHNEQSAAALRRDSDALDEVLDVRQQVRLRLLEERLERQKLDLLMLSRRRATPPVDGRKPLSDR
jgi:hypothetical protein